MRAVGAPFTDAERDAFIAAARRLRDAQTRFRHQGRNERGVDCAGLVIYALRAVGRPVEDCPGYGREPHKAGLESYLQRNLGEPAEGRQAGDVALMSFKGEPVHVGILTPYPYGGLALLHSYAMARKVVEHRFDDEWAGYVREVYRP